MAAPVATTTRMALRKRAAPTTTLTIQRDALILRFAKRPRANSTNTNVGGDDDETETDAVDDATGSDTESDYDDGPARRHATATAPASGALRVAVARGRGPVRVPTQPLVVDDATDKVLTFLQSAQLLNYPVRSGKWNDDEEAYLRKLVHLFNAGVLDGVESRTSMRMWLAKMLHCCPMRISKKQMHGEKFKGKAKYLKNADRIERMGQKDFDKSWQELHELRSNFLKTWAKEEFGRWGRDDRSRDFGEWYDTVVRNVPKPRLARNIRVVEPKTNKRFEPWATVRKDLEAVARKEQKTLVERQQMRRAKKRVQPSPPAVLDHHELAQWCQDDGHAIPTLDLSAATHESIFEPIQMAELEIDVDLATLVSEWDNGVSNPPVKTVLEPVDYNPDSSQLSPSIVLDFGPPSLWDFDPISKDSTLPSHCERLDDDVLGGEGMLSFDPAVLSSSDLPAEPWFLQLCTTFQL